MSVVGRVWPVWPVYLAIALSSFFLIVAFAWPAQGTDEEVVFQDAVDHVWWGVPPGFLMSACYEFKLEDGHKWSMRCGTWQFTYDDESGDLRPADDDTQRAWDYAVERQRAESE